MVSLKDRDVSPQYSASDITFEIQISVEDNTFFVDVMLKLAPQQSWKVSLYECFSRPAPILVSAIADRFFSHNITYLFVVKSHDRDGDLGSGHTLNTEFLFNRVNIISLASEMFVLLVCSVMVTSRLLLRWCHSLAHYSDIFRFTLRVLLNRLW